MGDSDSSKLLLNLESNISSVSSIESRLLVCKNNSQSQSKRNPQHPLDEKPVMSSVPKSQVLGRVKDFLGVMSEANKKLEHDAKDNARNFDIELLSDRESEYIEMDLMLGVTDLHTPEAVAAAEAAVAGHQPVTPFAGSSSGSESGDNSDEDDDNDEDNKDDVDSDCGNDNKSENDKCTSTKLERSKPVKDSASNKTSMDRRSKKRPKIVELS